ncbi:MAG TPA: hypothetical protein VIN59_01310 [Alphaproteobacteria bacterium]
MAKNVDEMTDDELKADHRTYLATLKTGEPRGFFGTLSEEQYVAVRRYRGPENVGDPMNDPHFAKKVGTLTPRMT